MLDDKKRLIFTGAVAAIAVALAAWWSSVANAADLGSANEIHHAESANIADVWSGPYLEAAIGMTSSNAELGVVGLGDILTLGDTGFSGHLGAGYDYMIAHRWIVGVLGRVEFNDTAYDALGITLAESDTEFMVGARVGFVPRSDWMLYALVGYKWADLELNNAIGGSVSKDGWVVGGGVEAMISDHVFTGLEYTATMSDTDTIGGFVNVENTDHAAKLRLGYKF